MSRRVLGVLCSLLLLSTISVGWYAWRLRSRLARAEFYMQSGVDSVFFICSPVIRALSSPGGPNPEILGIARDCVGQLSDAEMDLSVEEFRRKDIPAITKRIKAKLDDHEFPYKTASQVKSDFLPKSYRN